jgi:hypothetical protein
VPGSSTADRPAGAPAFQADGNEIALDRAQEDGAVAGILVDLLAAALALFLQRRSVGDMEVAS